MWVGESSGISLCGWGNPLGLVCVGGGSSGISLCGWGNPLGLVCVGGGILSS